MYILNISEDKKIPCPSLDPEVGFLVQFFFPSETRVSTQGAVL